MSRPLNILDGLAASDHITAGLIPLYSLKSRFVPSSLRQAAPVDTVIRQRGFRRSM